MESGDLLGNVCGGRGKCSFCGEMHNNVAYHEAWQCEKNKHSLKSPVTSVASRKSAPIAVTETLRTGSLEGTQRMTAPVEPCEFCDIDGYGQHAARCPVQLERSLAAKTAELGEAKAELERERMRLAACGIVAICNTRESAAQARDMHPDYRSASCDDVARSVDREMTLRKSLATLTRQRDGLKKALESQAAEWRNELVRLKLCNELGGPREASVKSKLQECEAALAAARKGRGMA